MSPNPAGTYAAGIILPLLGTVAVLLRFLAQKGHQDRVGISAWLIVIAAFLLWLLGATIITGVAIGSAGYHTPINPSTGEDEPGPAAFNLEKIEYAFFLIERLVFPVIKISVVFFYRRIFATRSFKRLSLAVIYLLVAWGIAFFFSMAFACGTDINYYFDGTAAYFSHCINIGVAEVAFAVSDVITDLIVLSLPLPWLWALRLNTQKKVAVTGIFLLGLLATAASLGKMAVWIELNYNTTIGARDFQGDITTCLVWGLVSAGIAVVAACLPALRPLAQSRTVESFLRSWNNTFSRRQQSTLLERQSESGSKPAQPPEVIDDADSAPSEPSAPKDIELGHVHHSEVSSEVSRD